MKNIFHGILSLVLTAALMLIEYRRVQVESIIQIREQCSKTIVEQSKEHLKTIVGLLQFKKDYWKEGQASTDCLIHQTEVLLNDPKTLTDPNWVDQCLEALKDHHHYFRKDEELGALLAFSSGKAYNHDMVAYANLRYATELTVNYVSMMSYMGCYLDRAKIIAKINRETTDFHLALVPRGSYLNIELLDTTHYLREVRLKIEHIPDGTPIKIKEFDASGDLIGTYLDTLYSEHWPRA